MRRFSFPAYKTYNVLYLILVSLLLTFLLRGKATHPGMVLGLVAIILGLQIITRTVDVHQSPMRRLIAVGSFIVLEGFACLVVGLGTDSQELWLSTWYAISSTLLIVDSELRRFFRLRRRYF